MPKIISTSSLRFLIGLPLSFVLACDGGDPEDPNADGTDEAEDTGDTGESGDTDDDGDADDDGLSDEEEAELGTDPNNVDTDGDTYWDSWEVAEGTDPLDPESRIYYGYWPYYPDKDSLVQGTWATASHSVNSQFPRATFTDQYGDEVEIYDFAMYTDNTTGAASYLIMDVAAQWCGPCHNIADWIAGNSDLLEDNYPTVRQKVRDRQAWWVTFVVQNVSGGPPTLADAETWADQHPDPNIPVFVDATQQVLDKYGSSQFPFFFLVDPVMGMEFWANADANEDPFFALALVDMYL